MKGNFFVDSDFLFLLFFGAYEFAKKCYIDKEMLMKPPFSLWLSGFIIEG